MRKLFQKSKLSPKTIYYICPKCQRASNKMILLDERHRPTDEERKRWDILATELLMCPCGLKLTWALMIPQER